MKLHVQEWLEYGPNTTQCEQALCDLGTLLGFEASRPDKSIHTGPDVLWLLDSPACAIGLEAKTDKTTGEYKKVEEIGQVHDHVKWIRDHHPNHQGFSTIVGKLFPVSSTANPPDDLRVLPLDGFKDIGSRIEDLLTSLSGLQMTDVEARLESLLRQLGLRWPDVWTSIPGKLATDLKSPLTDLELDLRR